MKVFCYGVHSVEEQVFNELNKDYNFELSFTDKLLSPETVDMAKGHDAVILMVNCMADKNALDKFKSFGIEYLLTRTVGTNHIDVKYAKELGFKMGRVPGYSPNAISELAFSLGMGMLRNNFYMYEKFSNQDFNVDSNMYSKEARFSTVGIIGTGRIGLECAKAWKGMGAKVIGFDVFQNDFAKEILEYKDLDEVLATSDVISLHIPYIPGEGGNYHFLDKEKMSKMKKGAIIVNTARGELIDQEALVEMIKSDHIGKAAVDVVEHEENLFFNKWNNNIPNKVLSELVNLKPRVIITPHIAYFTTEGVKNMVEVSYENLKNLMEGKECKNTID